MREAGGINDPFHLQRFVEAQAKHYEAALSEIRSGHKRSHWIWFVFPQVEGLGSSSMSRHYAIGSAAEAAAYLAHPVLGLRLRACVTAMNALPEHDARAILGDIDALKFHSSMTLFAEVARGDFLFRQALEKFFGDRRDPKTVAFLETR